MRACVIHSVRPILYGPPCMTKTLLLVYFSRYHFQIHTSLLDNMNELTFMTFDPQYVFWPSIEPDLAQF